MNKLFAVSVGLASALVLSACSSFSEESERDVEAVYQVNASDLSLKLVDGNSDEEDAIAWKKAVSILPNDILKQHVREYEVFSDGIENLLASVENIDTEGKTWVFAIDYADAIKPNSADFTTTLIHEFFHIVSLNDKQISRNFKSCSQYQIQEGCTKKNSYLNQFYQKFWDKPNLQKFQQSIKDLQGFDKEDAINDFYDKHSDEFVNEYSATNPVEDFTETFAFFVLSDKITNEKTIKEQKLNFFYQYPKLVKIRQHIRNRTNIRK